MNKALRIFSAIAALAWLAVLLITIFKPLIDCKTPLILASAMLVITYAVMFFTGGDKNARQIEEFNTEQGRDTKPDNKPKL